MLKKKKLLIPLVSLLAFGCSDNSPDDLTQVVPIAEVTYQEQVKPIIENNCVICHAMPPVNGAPISLTTFEQVRTAVLDHDLVSRISREEGSSELMPQGGPKLPQNLINIIVKWQVDGFKN